MNNPFDLPGTSNFEGLLERLSQQFARSCLPRGWIDGLTLANDGTDATNDIVISPGVCRSTHCIRDGSGSTLHRDQIDLEIPTAIIKQLDVAWAPAIYGGSRSGMLCPGSSISNTTWHIYVIGGHDKQSDVIAVDSATQSTVLGELRKTGYSAYRMIGSIIRASNAILAFIQDQDIFLLKTPTLDVDNSSPGTSAVTVAMGGIPLGIRVIGLFNYVGALNAGGIYIAPTDATDLAASSSAAPLSTAWAGGWNSAANIGGQVQCLTDTSAQIRYRNSANVVTRIATLGWRHPRGKNA